MTVLIPYILLLTFGHRWIIDNTV